MSLRILAPPHEEIARVGARSRREVGPLGAGTRWDSEQIDGENRYFQEVRYSLYNADVLVHSRVVRCFHATMEQLQMLDTTLQLVPPQHIDLLNERKPAGIRVADTTGRGASRRYMGGVNPSADYAASPDFDERRGIVITHGAFWENRNRGICVTVLHEIGHVMTHNGELSYQPFPHDRSAQLRGLRVSRNPGVYEGLCNAYMFFLCYGSDNAVMRDYGTNPPDIQKDAVTRRALRQTQAFTMLDSGWQSRFAERERR